MRKLLPNSINTSSMADISFLLLIFFLVTTTISNDKGLLLLLPPRAEIIPVVPIPGRNLMKVWLNSKDQIMVDGKEVNKPMELRQLIQEFVLNPSQNPNLSDSPNKATVSLRTDRGTTYAIYIAVLDNIQGAYYEMYGNKVGLTADEFRALNTSNHSEREIHMRAKKDLPMRISLAEPSGQSKFSPK